jgi:putative acetyltransferase
MTASVHLGIVPNGCRAVYSADEGAVKVWYTGPHETGHPPAELTVEIRRTRVEDLPEIGGVHRAAFGGRADEARLVTLLHVRNKAPISLVAAERETIVAHVLFSPVELDPAFPRLRLVGLAPIGVLPRYQRRGIGSRLIREGLQLCADAAYDAVVVLGDPGFYAGFGFVGAAENGLQSEFGAGEHFMVVELRPGALRGVRGMVKYAPEFREVGF